MSKKFSSIILSLFLLLNLPLYAFAANQVETMDIQALIYQDGSMKITQIWEGSFDEGTEVYIPMNAPDYLTISELIVSDQKGSYERVSDWNIDWSFEEKARKSGLHPIDGGYEICFGISEYGQNRYSISYKLDKVVGAYTDQDGVNFRFVNDDMNTGPSHVNLQIQLADGRPISDEIGDIWGFGFDGKVEFENGSIVASTISPLSEKNHVTILFALEKGILSPLRQEEESFEVVKERAFSGSDYDYKGNTGEEGSTFEALSLILLSVGLPIGLILWISRRKKKAEKKKLEKFSESYGYYRDLPNQGNLSATYSLSRLFNLCEESSILATGILRLIQLGCLSTVETQEIGFLGKTKEIVSLKLAASHSDKMNEYDEYLYTVLEAAAGVDGILQANELENFANQNDKLLRAYIQKHDSSGREYLNQKRCIKRWSSSGKLKDLTSVGEEELGQILGLKRYLEDFSLINQREIKEINIWRELLTYAMLFGIADQLAEQIKDLYPTISTEVTDYKQSMNTAYSYHYLLYRNMRQAEEDRQEQERNSGGGGFASFGGGGGSIGGGSGGGTR